MHLNTNHLQMVAKTKKGLEAVLADELRALGAAQVEPGFRAVTFEGDLEVLYKANLWCRTALSILIPIHRFRAKNEDELYNGVMKVDWQQYLKIQTTFAIDAAVHSEHFNHSKYVALKTKDAIVDQFKKKTWDRPSVDIRNPDLRLNLHIHEDHCTLSLDSSGDSLHRRGYRSPKAKAPLNEALAAGMVLLTGYDGSRPFIDPMCGSGTLVIEAAMIAYNIPPNLNRKQFGFQNWITHDPALWRNILHDAHAKRSKAKHFIGGYDRSFGAIKIAQEQAQNAGVADLIDWKHTAFEDLNTKQENGILVMNPPYGERIQSDDIEALYGMIGTQLKHHYSGYQAWLLSSNTAALKRIGLKPSKKLELYNGQLQCKYWQYEMYAGSKKDKTPIA